MKKMRNSFVRNIFSDVPAQQGALVEKWEQVDGYVVKDLLQDPRYPDLPSVRYVSTSFAEPTNWGDNYGSKITALFSPPMSGRYIFYIGESV